MVHGYCSEIETVLLPELAAFASLIGSNDRAVLFIDRATDDFISRYGQVSVLNFWGKEETVGTSLHIRSSQVVPGGTAVGL